jgi:CubicO group peptidase (beta-lactamase class C family)
VRGRRLTRLGTCTALFAVLLAAPAHAAKQCSEPGASWERATPQEAGFDPAKLQDAVDYGSTQASFAIRVYRYGCLVAEDRAAPAGGTQRYESWSMAKSVTSMLFGRAMTLGLISPDDPVGSLLPQADKEHGLISMRDLLTQSSGLEWNGLRDYNIFTMPDRVNDALTLKRAHPAGTYFEYAQSPVALLAEATGQSAGTDPQEFIQRELLDTLDIPAGSWRWQRDNAGHVAGFMGVNMRPDDFGRLGELMRRGGVWRGKRLLSEEYMHDAIAPSRTNGCYGWLIWLNSGKPCVGVRITEREVGDSREWPDMPVDMYRFSGLFGQLVTVFPSQGIVVVRTGQDPGLVNPAGGTDWEHELYARVLGSITEGKAQPAGDGGPDSDGIDRANPDTGFQNALFQPDRYRQGAVAEPLPPAGPARARAAQLSLARSRASRTGVVLIRLSCPPRGGTGSCAGRARLDGARKRLPYAVAPGASRTLRFKLSASRLKQLRKGPLTLNVVALNRAPGGSTVTRRAFAVRR